MTRPYEDFLTEVIPFTHDCPEVVAINAVRNACIEFCQKTLIWLHDITPIDGVKGQSDYTLVVPTDTDVVQIFDAWYGELPLTPRGEEDMRRSYVFDWRDVEGRPIFITQSEPKTVTVVPKPIADLARAITAIVALKPTRDSLTVDDMIYDRWLEQISWGARARLHLLSNQPFYDPATAEQCRRAFNEAIGQARVARSKGLTRANLRVRPPRFV